MRAGVLAISGRLVPVLLAPTPAIQPAAHAPLADCVERGREFFGERAASGDLRTAESIRTKLDQVNGAMAQFVGDVARSTAPEVWRAPFATFLQTWATFYGDARSSWWSQQWGDTYTQAERFETRLAEWQADFSRKGYGTLSGPRLLPEAGERARAAEGISTGLKVLGVGLVVAGVAYVVAKVVP